MNYQQAIELFRGNNPHLMSETEIYGFCGVEGVPFIAYVEPTAGQVGYAIVMDVCGEKTELQVFDEHGEMVAGFTNGVAY